MGEIVVNSRAVARFNFLRFDKFEARNRPLCIYLPLGRIIKDASSKYMITK